MDEAVSHRHNHRAVVVSAIAVFVLLPFVFFYFGYKYQKSVSESKPTTFDECAKENNLIQQSYPRVCVTKSGERFVEPLTPEQQEGLKPPPSESSQYPGWLMYTNQEFKIRLQYPPEWRVLENSQLFEQGDLFGIQILGRTQTTGTEIHDGAMVGIAKPLAVSQSAESWARNYYKESPSGELPQFSSETINGILYVKVYTCGLGCFTYYHTKRDNMLYRVVTFAEGPDQGAYEKQINQILSSFTFEK